MFHYNFFMDRFLVIDKPAGMTSFGVVARVRRMLNVKKVGHGGTLDPLATGVLVLGLGKATKQLGTLLGADKEYETVIRLGAVSDTYDADGKIEMLPDVERVHFVPPTEEEIRTVIVAKFTGEIDQMPPIFSALKVGGKKACDMARKGIAVELKSRKVTLYEVDLLSYLWPELRLRVVCSTGTYIRSLAHDLGRVLACGGLVQELRRTRVGDYRIEDALTLEGVQKSFMSIEG